MFERFTKEARAIAVGAAEEARALGADAVGQEHLLLGVLRSAGAGAAALRAEDVTLDAARAAAGELPERALAALGISLEDVRTSTGASLLPSSPSRRLPFAPGAKRVLEDALRVALDRGDRQIGSEHVTLALVDDARGSARRLLAVLGVDAGAVAARLHAAPSG